MLSIPIEDLIFVLCTLVGGSTASLVGRPAQRRRPPACVSR